MCLEVVLILRSSTDYLIQVLGSLLVVFGLVLPFSLALGGSGLSAGFPGMKAAFLEHPAPLFHVDKGTMEPAAVPKQDSLH